MKITVTGSLGHISQPLVKELLQNGHSVTVISSNPGKQKDIEALGATATIGSLEDQDFLASAFNGADAVYTMIPPPDFSNPELDMMSSYQKIANNYVHAIEQSGVKRVVHLSSIGAHLDKNTGILIAHHAAENIMNDLQNVALTFMRPSAFFYNLYAFSDMIKNTGSIMSNYGGEDIIPWVSPLDIASAIAKEIVSSSAESKVIYVASEELSCNEVARILGEAIGKPELKWILITDEQMLNALKGIGMPEGIASDLAEMNASMHSGEAFKDYYNNRPQLGKVKLKEFATEFAGAFNGKPTN